MRIWSLAVTAAVAPFRQLNGVDAVAVSPDGTLIASGGRDGQLHLWTRDGRDQVAPIQAHRGPVTSVAFSGDGRQLASGGEDGVVRLLTRALVSAGAPLTGHEGMITGVAFLASGGVDGTVRLWTSQGRAGEPWHDDRVETCRPSGGHRHAADRPGVAAQDSQRLAGERPQAQRAIPAAGDEPMAVGHEKLSFKDADGVKDVEPAALLQMLVQCGLLTRNLGNRHSSPMTQWPSILRHGASHGRHAMMAGCSSWRSVSAPPPTALYHGLRL